MFEMAILTGVVNNDFSSVKQPCLSSTPPSHPHADQAHYHSFSSIHKTHTAHSTASIHSQVTPSCMFLAAFSVVLHRKYSNTLTDVVSQNLRTKVPRFYRSFKLPIPRHPILHRRSKAEEPRRRHPYIQYQRSAAQCQLQRPSQPFQWPGATFQKTYRAHSA